MIHHIAKESVIFIDLETVPAAPEFSQLQTRWQNLWIAKHKSLGRNDAPEDSYERAGIYAEFGKIICITLGYYTRKGNARRIISFYGHDEMEILNGFLRWLKKHYTGHHRFCAHNGKEFDYPWLCRRMLILGLELPECLQLMGKKPWEIPHLDTLELWKFGDYKHYTPLQLLAAVFNADDPKQSMSGGGVYSKYWLENDLESIREYCEADVLTLMSVFEAMQGRNIPTET
jgi:3'-5' exonuclease